MTQTNQKPDSHRGQIDFEVLLLGTGTSSQVPAISCLTAPPGQGCACCLSTLQPEGAKNIRRNTSAIVKVHKGIKKGERPRTILIDVGKSFCEAAREHFPRNAVRELDAVLLTHPHADAVNGLDDLRAWTLGGVIQDSVHVYCDAYTLKEIDRMYPYMRSAAAVTGGGDVPTFQWHVIDGPFDLFGVRIAPLPVHHGTFFSDEDHKPYICLAFLFDQAVMYMADVSAIPETTVALFDTAMSHQSASAQSVNGAASARPSNRPLPLLVLDCLRIAMHFSHFGVQQAVVAADQLHAQRSYILGFAHRISHDTWVHCCEAISQGQKPTSMLDESYRPQVQGATSRSEQAFKTDDPEVFTEEALQEIYAFAPSFQGSPWMRPAFDGLRIYVDSQGEVWDSGYA